METKKGHFEIQFMGVIELSLKFALVIHSLILKMILQDLFLLHYCLFWNFQPDVFLLRLAVSEGQSSLTTETN